MFALSLLFGAIVGLALGLTGGGGGVFAVPMLVYGLAIAPQDAVGISLAAVGGTALIGMLPRLRSGDVELGTGMLFATSGMLGAPLGSWISGQIPETLLLLLFAGLMILVAARMWARSSLPAENTGNCDEKSTCQRTPEGRLRLSSRCAMLLLIVGLAAGVLAGLFGVGGGFVIVPALIIFSGMPLRRAIGTSLLVIVMVSATGVMAHYAAGRSIPWEIAALFLVGGVVGMQLGSRIGRLISTKELQRVFATAIIGVAVFVIARTIN